MLMHGMTSTILDMFDLTFGWRKASECKKLMKKLRCRLNLLKNKRCCIVRQLRNDVAQLIKNGHHQTASNRVDEIYKDECIIAVYDLMVHFCEFLSLQLPYIGRSKDCPNDINEAISSLIFASARCGELPELVRIRKLFSQRYGERFEARAVGLLPGNLVNFQIIENLSINKVPKEVKYKLLEEIMTSGLQTRPLAYLLEYNNNNNQQATNGTGNINIGAADVDFSLSQSAFDHPAEITTSSDIEEFQPQSKDDQRVFIFAGINMLISNSMHCDHHWKKCADEAAAAAGGGVMRSYSFPVGRSSSRHVHPKLPDYDELAAKFMALKKQKFQNQEIRDI